MSSVDLSLAIGLAAGAVLATPAAPVGASLPVSNQDSQNALLSPPGRLASASLAFPDGFLWGVGTSAYQNEGHNFNSDWYLFERGELAKKARELPIRGSDVAGRAADFLHRYPEDVAAARDLGAGAFRLSVEWSRVEPRPGEIDARELDRYQQMIQAVRRAGMTPVVTLHHFSNPIWLVKAGGWARSQAIERFDAFVAAVVARLKGDVEWWLTFNEPMVMAVAAYVSGDFPPGRRNEFMRALRVAANLLKAHARAYRTIHRLAAGRARVGIAHHLVHFAPYHEEGLLGDADRHLARLSDQLINRSFPDAVASGRIRMEALLFRVDEQVPGLQGSADFFGLNYYQRVLVNSLNPTAPNGTFARPGTPRNDLGWEIVPEGMYHTLLAAAGYGLPVLITETGLADRTRALVPWYLASHLAEVHRAVRAGADVRGFLYWTLTDNFEWHNGYFARFGLLAVDRADPELKREPTPGSAAFREIATGNAVSRELLGLLRHQ